MHQIPIAPLDQGECSIALSGYDANVAVCGRPQVDACQIDAGSALACTTGDGQYHLKGIYSTENQCNSPAQIVTFAKMDVKWIKDTTAAPSSSVPQHVPQPNYGQQVQPQQQPPQQQPQQPLLAHQPQQPQQPQPQLHHSQQPQVHSQQPQQYAPQQPQQPQQSSHLQQPQRDQPHQQQPHHQQHHQQQPQPQQQQTQQSQLQPSYNPDGPHGPAYLPPRN